MQNEEKFEIIKGSVLDHVQKMFNDIEKEIAISHQEKIALLEDAFENATDEGELKVAFDQWFAEHSEEVGFDMEADDLWDAALAGQVEDESYISHGRKQTANPDDEEEAFDSGSLRDDSNGDDYYYN
jgi:hypothetical protein